jgi:hypothetical protein
LLEQHLHQKITSAQPASTDAFQADIDTALQAYAATTLASQTPENAVSRLSMARRLVTANIQDKSQANSEVSASKPTPLLSPVFHHPLYEGIRELKPDLLLPGADLLEDNTVLLLKTNPAFIEAFMVGANHEMARELLWRNFPTEQHDTYFQSFWSYGKPDFEKPLQEWDNSLGTHFNIGTASGQDEQVVMVLRAELLRRFPDAVIYAAKAESPGSLSHSEHRYPLHSGQLTDDAVFLLFDLTQADIKGDGDDHGWFFVIQQQPTAPLFGIDEIAGDADEATLNGGYYSVADFAPAPNSAALAKKTLRKPFLIAVHGKRWIDAPAKLD